MSWADRSDPGCWMTIQVRMSRRFRGLPGCTKTLRLSLLARISNEDLSDGVAHVHPVLQAMLPLLAYAPMRLWQGRGPTLCRRGAVCQTPRLFFRLVAVLYVFSAIPNDCARTSLQCHARGAGQIWPTWCGQNLRPNAKQRTTSRDVVRCFYWNCWWSGGGSNSRPSHCERDALPAELPPQQSTIIHMHFPAWQ